MDYNMTRRLADALAELLDASRGFNLPDGTIETAMLASAQANAAEVLDDYATHLPKPH